MMLFTVIMIFTIITLLATKSNLLQNNSPEKGIKTKNVKEVKTEIGFLSGTLNITAQDLNKLYSGEYEYQKDEWKPEINYTEQDGTGFLKIISEDESEEKNYNSSLNNKWDIKLNKNVKNDLFVKMKAGEGKFNLCDSRINRFNFQMAAGDIDINLRNTSLQDLNLKAIAGKVSVDLSGQWNNDLHASMTGGAGELVLIIPENTGAEIEITGLLANIYAPDFNKEGHTYTNRAFGKSKYSLYIDVFGGIGDIELKLIN